jgi:predicted nucleic acid-binding protein
MRVYLDNCALNRPFDDQSSDRIKAESEAVATILENIRSHSVELVWSSAIDYENGRSPVTERREAVSQWRSYSLIEITAGENVEHLAHSLLELGIDKLDAIHIASSITGSADYFVTTDDRILKRGGKIGEINIVNPVDLAEKLQK